MDIRLRTSCVSNITIHYSIRFSFLKIVVHQILSGLKRKAKRVIFLSYFNYHQGSQWHLLQIEIVVLLFDNLIAFCVWIYSKPSPTLIVYMCFFFLKYSGSSKYLDLKCRILCFLHTMYILWFCLYEE